MQLELPLGLADEGGRPGTMKGLARSRADRAVDAIRKHFGAQAVDYGSASRVGRSVPDEFRRLAEEAAGTIPEAKRRLSHCRLLD